MADNINLVTLVGNLGADPELRRTPTGKDVVSFTLVTNERVRGADGAWTDGPASWFKVTAWDDLGRNAATSFRKGQRVIARGTLKVQTWQARDGGTGKTVELTARSLGHDVLGGTTSFVKNVRPTERQQAPTRQADDGWGGPSPQEREEEPPGASEQPAMALASSSAGAPLAQPQWSTGLGGDDDVPF